MKYNVIFYLIGEGFSNVFKNKKSTLACLGIMCATMVIFGIFFAVIENINHIISQIEDDQAFEVFIQNTATEEQTKELGDKILAIEGVNNIKYKSKEDALTQMKERFNERQGLLEGMTIFPASYVVNLSDLTLSKDVQNKILEFENVKRITSSDDTVNKLVNIANGVRIVSGIILVLLVLISVFIITNTIKLTVHARRKEISIMKYVGATNGFIRWPFIVEGVTIGVLASILSLLIIGGGYNIITNKLIGNSFNNIIDVSLLGFNDMFKLILIVYLILGVGIGVVGSSISMKKYLQV